MQQSVRPAGSQTRGLIAQGICTHMVCTLTTWLLGHPLLGLGYKNQVGERLWSWFKYWKSDQIKQTLTFSIFNQDHNLSPTIKDDFISSLVLFLWFCLSFSSVMIRQMLRSGNAASIAKKKFNAARKRSSQTVRKRQVENKPTVNLDDLNHFIRRSNREWAHLKCCLWSLTAQTNYSNLSSLEPNLGGLFPTCLKVWLFTFLDPSDCFLADLSNNLSEYNKGLYSNIFLLRQLCWILDSDRSIHGVVRSVISL